MFCENPQNDAERTLCACLGATTSFVSLVDTYNKSQKHFESQLESYKRWKADWNNWKNKTGKYSKFRNYGENNAFWANEHDGTCWWGQNWNAAHQWCHDMATSKGYDGENYMAKKWGWCYGRFGNFLCTKPDHVLHNQLKDYKAAEPQVDPESGKLWNGVQEPTPPDAPSGNNIMCCTQLFNDIDVNNGNVSFKDTSLKCIQKITNALQSNNEADKLPYNNSDSAWTLLICLICISIILLIVTSF